MSEEELLRISTESTEFIAKSQDVANNVKQLISCVKNYDVIIKAKESAEERAKMAEAKAEELQEKINKIVELFNGRN